MVDQDTVERVAAAIESANIGHSLHLVQLVDGEATYRVEIDGRTETFVDNDEADAIDQGYEFIRNVKQRRQAEAVIAALTIPPSQTTLQDDSKPASNYNLGADIIAPPETRVRSVDTSILRELVSRAIFDPGITEGYKNDRTLTDWQTDAVMRVLGYAATEGQP